MSPTVTSVAQPTTIPTITPSQQTLAANETPSKLGRFWKAIKPDSLQSGLYRVGQAMLGASLAAGAYGIYSGDDDLKKHAAIGAAWTLSSMAWLIKIDNTSFYTHAMLSQLFLMHAIPWKESPSEGAVTYLSRSTLLSMNMLHAIRASENSKNANKTPITQQ